MQNLSPVSRKLRYPSGSYRFVTAVDSITLRAVARRDFFCDGCFILKYQVIVDPCLFKDVQ